MIVVLLLHLTGTSFLVVSSSHFPQRSYSLVINPLSADQTPDVSLAQMPLNVASGSSVANMPIFAPPIPLPEPSLKPFDIHDMGVDTSEYYFDFGLAQIAKGS